MKNRSLAYCPEYGSWKPDFTLSEIRENQVLLCTPMVMSIMDISDTLQEGNEDTLERGLNEVSLLLDKVQERNRGKCLCQGLNCCL